MSAPAVVFDVGSTLVHPDFERLSDWVTIKTSILIDPTVVEYAFRKAISGDVFGALDSYESQAVRFFQLCGCDRSTSERWPHWWQEVVQSGGARSWLYTSLDAEAKTTLQYLDSIGCTLIAASNSDGTLRSELAQFDLLSFFVATFDSYDIGVEKPDPKFFEYIFKAQSQQREFIHVGDDLVKDFVAPLTAGFEKARLFDPADVFPGIPSAAKIKCLSALKNTIRPIS
jgi:HAD superfamily hydrolase (TIGR01549 family)